MTAPSLIDCGVFPLSRCSSNGTSPRSLPPPPFPGQLRPGVRLFLLWPVSGSGGVWCCGFFPGRPRNLVLVVLVAFVLRTKFTIKAPHFVILSLEAAVPPTHTPAPDGP